MHSCTLIEKVLDKDLHILASLPLTSTFLRPCCLICEVKLMGKIFSIPPNSVEYCDQIVLSGINKMNIKYSKILYVELLMWLLFNVYFFFF